MKREILYCTQGEADWFEARLGRVTASCFDAVMAKGRGGGESVTRRKYMLTLIGEHITRRREEGHSNAHMERGKAMEEEARNAYAFMTGNDVEQVGLVTLGDDIAASPDGLIGNDGNLEIKTKLPHLHLDCLLRDEVPAEHMKQIQGQMWVADREWTDFVSYWPGLPIFIKRVPRDSKIITEIHTAVSLFLEEMHETIEQIKRRS